MIASAPELRKAGAECQIIFRTKARM